MDAERWASIAELFAGAMDLPAEERDAFLQRACATDPTLRADVRRLIDAHEGKGSLDVLADQLTDDIDAALPASLDHGTHIGNYRVIDNLGSGGMGDVYLAVREGEGFEQRVAVKVLRSRAGASDDGMAKRFRSERSILARLDHPNIPRFLDGGLTRDGAPYFAMEFVEGVPIGRYCDDHQLTVRERLALFASVCDAVQYAHQHLVVHRDLKPSNILVTGNGIVKVLDFGIAKLLDTGPSDPAMTGTGPRWLTPDYASPEQIRGDVITTASDVFALGIVLYELLTCTRPYTGRTRFELERAILETEPQRPSAAVAHSACVPARRDRLRRELAGDLDTIGLRALSKSPVRRYGSAGELGDDLRRYLAGLPVHARPDTLGYRTRKFAARHRVMLAAVVIAALSLIGGSIASVVAARRAALSAQVAVRERDRAEEVSRFAVGLFSAANPRETGAAEVTARSLVDSGAARLRRELADQPSRRAAMLDVLSQSYVGLGRYAEARETAAEVLALRRSEVPPQPALLADALEKLGEVYVKLHMTDSAGPLAREALGLRRRPGASASSSAAALGLLGDYFHGRGEVDSAEHYFSAAIRESGPATDMESQVELLTNLVYIRSQRREFAAAESLQTRILELMRTSFGPRHPKVAEALGGLVMTRMWQGKMSEARATQAEAYQIRLRAFGPRHPDVARTMHHMGFLALAADDLDSASYWFGKAVALRRELLGERDPAYAQSLSRLGAVRRRQGQPALAAALHAQALKIYRASSMPPAHSEIVTAELEHASALSDLGRLSDAETVLSSVRARLARIDTGKRLPTVDSMLAALRSRRTSSRR